MDLLSKFNNAHIAFNIDDPEVTVGDSPIMPTFEGTCVILGTHPCYKDDLKELEKHTKNYDICGVNEAGKLRKLTHLATCHEDRMNEFVGLCRYNKDTPMLHARDTYKHRDQEYDYPVQGWPIKLMAGSAPFAAAVMYYLGYDRIVFCGCPMEGGGGYAFKETHPHTRDDPRVGSMEPDHPALRTWHLAMRKFKKLHPEKAAKMCSASGVTKEIFGGLDGQF